ncbi:MAG: prolyl oligopeptidase family serine peptidase [Chloroflexota bacterium]
MTQERPQRFDLPLLVTMRPARGPLDAALLVYQSRDGSSGAVWTPAGGAVPIAGLQVPLSAALSPDGRTLFVMADDHGSEVGHIHAFLVDGSGPAIDCTPALGGYVVRGIDIRPDGRALALTLVDGDGFTLRLIPLVADGEPGDARTLFHSASEAWNGILSADGSLAAIETTGHNPGTRRFAVTVVDVASATVVAVLTDGPLGPVRRIRFSAVPGDDRLLAYTERSGFARPVVWNPRTGERIDIGLPDLAGDVLPLDWDAATGRVLLCHVDGGIHHLLEHSLTTGRTEPIDHPDGACVELDTGDAYPDVFSSHYAADGSLRLVTSRWDVPVHVVGQARDGAARVLVAPAPVPAGQRLASQTLTSRDGTPVQLWWAAPDDCTPRGTILSVHGGPTYTVPDRYDPSAQAWLDAGYACASLNFRGSVTFGRAFREGFWGRTGDAELEDVEAALDWLAGRGLADPRSTFMTGPSYGGFLTLLSLGRLPDRFAGGLAIVAMADWAAAYASMNPALQAAWRGFIGGTPETEPERFARYSPISYVDKVRAPVWLWQGQFDSRTPASQAQRYADALRAVGGDVVIEFFPGGHAAPGLTELEFIQERSEALVERALRGERWSA